MNIIRIVVLLIEYVVGEMSRRVESVYEGVILEIDYGI